MPGFSAIWKDSGFLKSTPPCLVRASPSSSSAG
jgi:hypothetical protein